MDEERFDRMARSVGGREASRRSVLGVVVGGGIAALRPGVETAAKERCPRKERCGGDCCKDCFAKSVNPGTGKQVGKACCPRSKVCKDPAGTLPDECCYDDEVCQPRGAADRGSLCCRRCADPVFGGCCTSQRQCTNNGRCRVLTTARLPRRRA